MIWLPMLAHALKKALRCMVFPYESHADMKGPFVSLLAIPLAEGYDGSTVEVRIVHHHTTADGHTMDNIRRVMEKPLLLSQESVVFRRENTRKIKDTPLVYEHHYTAYVQKKREETS